jgi:hypothetical protein
VAVNWQVQGQIAVNVDDCQSEEEAIKRVLLCLRGAKLQSVKAMRVIDVAHPKAIARGKNE